MITILKQCRSEILKFPEEVRGDIADALARLDIGEALSMPLSRSMPDIGKRVSELRLKDKSGEYRVIYIVITRGTIYVIHAFKKKTRKTPEKNIKLITKRIRELDL